MKHLLFSIFFLFCTCDLPALIIKCNENLQPIIPPQIKPQKKKYAIYLTTGVKAHKHVDTAWGGCHITLAGFHRKHAKEAFLNKIPQIIKDNCALQQGWRPKQIKLQKWGKHWAIVFHSKTLNKVVKQLAKERFKKVKGPEFCGSPFHMILPDVKDQKAAEVFARSLQQQEWFITVVEMAPSERSRLQASWIKYFRF